jgi:2-dehydro-3-deoxygluconokinase
LLPACATASTVMRLHPGKPRVVTLGESMLRLSTTDRLQQVDSLAVHVAGSESNVAVALAQLGWDAVWLSALPDTPVGRRVASELAGCGVDVSQVRWVDGGRVGLFFVEFAEAPRSTTVWYDRAHSAASALEPGDLDTSLLDAVDYAVVCGITAGLGDGPRRLALRFAREARARGARVCVDVNYRPRLWDEATAAAAIAELAGAADVVVCSARDAASLWGIGGESLDAVRRLRDELSPGAELVVVTTGADGAVAVASDGTLFEQPAYATTVVDRIGAGDAFLAGVLWGLQRGDIAEALRAGALAAALKCTMRGDHFLTSPHEFLHHLEDRQRQLVVR